MGELNITIEHLIFRGLQLQLIYIYSRANAVFFTLNGQR